MLTDRISRFEVECSKIPEIMKMLPYGFKIPGMCMATTGFLMGILYFLVDFRFEFPVFAVVSTYMETRFFTFFRTNFADELIMFLLLAGCFLVAFSREKHEHEGLKILREMALKRAVVADVCILLFSILFIYGSGFLAMLLLQLFLPFILYLSFFYFLRSRTKMDSFH